MLRMLSRSHRNPPTMAWRPGLLLALLVAIGWLTISAAPVRAAGDCTVTAANAALDTEEQAMLNGINAYRQQHGLSTLKASPTLTNSAAWLSTDMATKNYFSHTDSLGRSLGARLADCGYTHGTYMGENIAAGYADAANTLNQWKNSPPHNANLLGASYVVAGIGRYNNPAAAYQWYWTLDLGNYDDSGSGGPPPGGGTVPGAPTGVSAAAGNASATVSWTAPASNGGASITSYTVTASPGGSTATAGGSATNAVVTGLTNGVTYTFTVHATNSYGNGPESIPSGQVKPGSLTAPAAPTGVSATAGNAQATVAWSAPASNGGSAITSYTVTSSPGGITAVTPDGSTTAATVTGLTNGTAYTFTVHATNSVGNGPESAPSNPVTPVRRRR